MKKGDTLFLITSLTLYFVITLFLLINSVNALDNSSDTMQVRANILAETVSIEVPDEIFLGNTTRGYEMDYTKIYMNNTGTTNVQITPQLSNSSEKIFKYLYFAKRTTEDFVKIGDFSINITKPTTFGGKNDEYCYIKLNLKNYSEEISSEMLNHQTDIIFWAMPY